MLQTITEQVIERGFQSGDLIDASELLSTPLPAPVAVTRTLWRSLCWPYLTAQRADYIELASLVEILHTSFSLAWKSADDNRLLLEYVPYQKPAWIADDFAIGVCFQYPDSMLLFLIDDPTSCRSDASALPASLLVKLLCLISRLSLCARKADQSAVVRLLRLAQQLAIAHPLGPHITGYMASGRKSMEYPSHLTREEYRALLLEDLGHLLELLAACGLDTDTALLMGEQYDVLCSPLNELLYLTRSLQQLAGAVPPSRKHLLPVKELLVADAVLKDHWHNGSYLPIPHRHFTRLTSICYALAKLLPRKHQEQLSLLRQSLAVLESVADGFACGITYPFKFHQYH